MKEKASGNDLEAPLLGGNDMVEIPEKSNTQNLHLEGQSNEKTSTVERRNLAAEKVASASSVAEKKNRPHSSIMRLLNLGMSLTP
jgi:hypothetical protein